MIVLDASLPIVHFDSTDAQHTRAEDLLLSVADEPLAASPLTLIRRSPHASARVDGGPRAIKKSPMSTP